MNKNEIVAQQQAQFEKIFSPENIHKWDFHSTKDPLTRYLRDRRLHLGLDTILKSLRLKKEDVKNWEVLVVCGGVGGEGMLLANYGFESVTVSDFSENALVICKQLDSRLKTLVLNAEEADLLSGSYDLVVVQDGLHHLSRPALGFTEMIRIARKAVLVVEPYTGFVGEKLGTEWEKHGETINFVFRWNKNFFTQVTKSYLLKDVHKIIVLKVWDHSIIVLKLLKLIPKRLKTAGAKAIYGLLNTFLKPWGNMMIGIVIKNKH